MYCVCVSWTLSLCSEDKLSTQSLRVFWKGKECSGVLPQPRALQETHALKMSLLHQLLVLGEEQIFLTFGTHKLYRDSWMRNVAYHPRNTLVFGLAKQITGGGNSCATIYRSGMKSGCCFYFFPFWKPVSFESPFDCDGFIFWCIFISKILGNLFSRFMETKIHGSDEKGCLTSVRTYVPAHVFMAHTWHSKKLHNIHDDTQKYLNY